MKVRDLISFLSTMSQDAEVYVSGLNTPADIEFGYETVVGAVLLSVEDDYLVTDSDNLPASDSRSAKAEALDGIWHVTAR